MDKIKKAMNTMVEHLIREIKWCDIDTAMDIVSDYDEIIAEQAIDTMFGKNVYQIYRKGGYNV